MFSTRYIKSLIMAAAAVAAACTSDPVDNGSAEPLDDTEPASLTIDFSVADLGIGVSTRTDTDPGTGTEYTLGEMLDPEHPERMNEDAAYVNGNKMGGLVVLLIHKRSNRIVAVRQFPGLREERNSGNGFIGADGKTVDVDLESGSRARVTFEYDQPLHTKNGESAEKLKRGEYRLFAIANYSHTVPTSETNSQPAALTDPPSTGHESINLRKILENIIAEFRNKADVGINDFNPDYECLYNLRFLMNCTLKTIDAAAERYEVVPAKDANGKLPYIRPAVRQTLSASQNVFLTAGKNNISVELLRISSRTRVEVKNYSKTPLKVHSLEFSDNYTQATNYLFRREYHDGNYVELRNNFYGVDGNPGDGEVTGYPSFTGAPNVSFKEIINTNGSITPVAIVPFVKDWDSDGKDGVDGVKVESGEKRCIFDAMAYESYDAENPFTYTIDVSYPQEKGYRTIDPGKIDLEADHTIEENGGFDYVLKNEAAQYLTGFSDVEALRAIVENYKSEEGYYFLIQGLKTKRFLQEQATADGAGRLYAQKLKDDEINLASNDIKTYLWKVKMVKSEDGTVSCELINLNSGKYLPRVPAGVEMHTLQATPWQHTLDVDGNKNAVLFAANYSPAVNGHGTYYLNVFGERENLGGWYDGKGIEENTNDDDNSKFLLYPVESVPVYIGTPRMKKKVTLTTFSDETAYVEEVHEIQRNDFVRILVEVSYNPDASDFMFKVNPWDKKTGTVEFH